MSPTTILGISGSLRSGSHNTALIHAARRLRPEDVAIELYAGLSDIPPYDADLDTPNGLPAVVRDLRHRVSAADGLLIATPEYNYSVPGVLKNAIDWVSTDVSGAEGLPLRDKPVAIVGASPSAFGSVRAQLALRQVLLWTRSRVVIEPEVTVFRSHERFTAEGELADEATAGLLFDLLGALVGEIRNGADRTARATLP